MNEKWRLFTLVAFIGTIFTYSTGLTVPDVPRVAVVGGGISGLVVGHVLQQSGRYNVQLFESEPQVGGNIRSIPDPLEKQSVLNIGHATHLGMFLNLRLMLRHLGVQEWPVGKGPNETPGLFRMLSVTVHGNMFQPPLDNILSLKVWWEAFLFYYHSYRQPEQRLDEFFATHKCSETFQDLVYWAMATFEFDKHQKEAGEYALGAARALLITQVFFQYLLCDAFEGSLPPKVDDGLADELAARIDKQATMSTELKRRVKELQPLGTYFTANYGQVMDKLADGIGRVRTSSKVSKVSKKNGKILIQTANGDTEQVDTVIFTTQPSIIVDVLNRTDFSEHVAAFDKVESGAVGVRIIHAKDLPFSYPPSHGSFSMSNPPPILGNFDISELTTSRDGQKRRTGSKAGWLSVAYPVYKNKTLNRHQEWLNNVPCADETVYPWTRATSTFPRARRDIVALEGLDGLYVTGHTLTGVNKASELQLVNALNLCYDHFGVLPPWKEFFPFPPLPDCNDHDAFLKPISPFECLRLATKNLVGSFLLTGVVAKLGVSIFGSKTLLKT